MAVFLQLNSNYGMVMMFRKRSWNSVRTCSMEACIFPGRFALHVYTYESDSLCLFGVYVYSCFSDLFLFCFKKKKKGEKRLLLWFFFSRKEEREKSVVLYIFFFLVLAWLRKCTLSCFAFRPWVFVKRFRRWVSRSFYILALIYYGKVWLLSK